MDKVVAYCEDDLKEGETYIYTYKKINGRKIGVKAIVGKDKNPNRAYLEITRAIWIYEIELNKLHEKENQSEGDLHE